MALTELINTLLIAGSLAGAYDLTRRMLRQLRQPPPLDSSKLQALTERVDTNERAFKATLLDWRARFDELDKKVDALPTAVESKVAGTVAALGALPTAQKQWR